MSETHLIATLAPTMPVSDDPDNGAVPGDSTALRYLIVRDPSGTVEVGATVRITAYCSNNSKVEWRLTDQLGHKFTPITYVGMTDFIDEVKSLSESGIQTTYPVDRLYGGYGGAMGSAGGAWAETTLISTITGEVVASAGAILTQYVFICRGNLTLSVGGHGSVKVWYTPTPRVYWDWKAPRTAGSYTLVIIGPEGIHHTETIEVVQAESEGPALVNIMVKDFCTGQKVPNADVWVDSTYIAKSDANGKVTVGLLDGGTHTLKIEAPTYLDSDIDSLENDSFVV